MQELLITMLAWKKKEVFFFLVFEWFIANCIFVWHYFTTNFKNAVSPHQPVCLSVQHADIDAVLA